MKQHGFTLIELVVVIIILGILAATAIPKFVDLKGDAAQGAANGVAAAVTSASTLNYAKYQISPAAAQRLNGATACNTLVTSAVAGIGLTGGLPTAVTITTDPTCAAQPAGTAVTCVLQSSDDTTKTANATVLCTG